MDRAPPPRAVVAGTVQDRQDVHDAVPGTVLGMGDEKRLLVALAGGHALALAKLRVGEGGKVAAGEAGLGPGDRLS